MSFLEVKFKYIILYMHTCIFLKIFKKIKEKKSKLINLIIYIL